MPAARIAVLINPNAADVETATAEVQAAASTLGQQIDIIHAGTNREIDAAFATMVQMRAGALLVIPNTLFVNRRLQLATLATRHAIPAMYTSREYAEVGGLMTYGANLADTYHQAGVYTGRILKGAKPADLLARLSHTIFA